MSTGYVSADRLLMRTLSPSVSVFVSTSVTDELAAHGREVISHESPAIPKPEADTAFWRQKSEALQLIIADLLLTNQQLRASENARTSKATTTQWLHIMISRTMHHNSWLCLESLYFPLSSNHYCNRGD
jgi:hypothetical protein